MSSLDDLLLELMDAPTDDNFLVYADAASLQGDPRGELIVVQHALANHALSHAQRAELRAREAALLEYDSIVGPLAAIFEPGAPALTWRNGFIHAARLDRAGFCRPNNLADGVEVVDAIDALLSHPSAALLHQLTLSHDSAEGTGELPPTKIHTAFGWDELQAIARHRPYTLRRLVLNDRWEQTDPERPYYYDNSWYKLSGFHFLNQLPDLEHLELIGGDFLGLDELTLPLRSLALRTGGLRRARIGGWLARPQPRLERLELWFGQEHYGADIGVDDLRPLLDATNFPKLRWLGLMNAEFTDDLVEVLGRSPILRQLAGLSLSLGSLSRVGMRHLINDAGYYKHLREFDVSQSLLDVPSQRALANAFPSIRIGTQRGDSPGRYAAIGE